MSLLVILNANRIGWAQNREAPPPGFEGATITPKDNVQVPLNLEFTDEKGQTVRLGDYFKKDRPVILSMVYYNCPMLCNLTMNGMVTAARQMPLEVTTQYEVVWVSFDPREKPPLAQAKKNKYMQELGQENGPQGWHLLTGTEKNARLLGETLGFGYKLDPKGKEYMHQAAIYVCTPDGRVARTIEGVQFEPLMLKDSLINAAQGKISSGIFGIALSCGLYNYDTETGRYVWAAQTLMRVTGLLTVVLLGSFIGLLVYRDSRKRRHETPPSTPPMD